MFEVQKGHSLYHVVVIKTDAHGDQQVDKMHVPAFNEEDALTKIPLSYLNPQGYANVTVQIAD